MTRVSHQQTAYYAPTAAGRLRQAQRLRTSKRVSQLPKPLEPVQGNVWRACWLVRSAAFARVRAVQLRLPPNRPSADLSATDHYLLNTCETLAVHPGATRESHSVSPGDQPLSHPNPQPARPPPPPKEPHQMAIKRRRPSRPTFVLRKCSVDGCSVMHTRLSMCARHESRLRRCCASIRMASATIRMANF